MKSTGRQIILVRSGVLVAQCAEGPAGLVRREPLVSESEDGAPVLEDAADEADADVVVLVQPRITALHDSILWSAKLEIKLQPPRCPSAGRNHVFRGVRSPQREFPF